MRSSKGVAVPATNSSVLTFAEAAALSPAALRQAIREGEWRGPTVGLAPDFLQANLAVVPQEMAFEFMLFCHRNALACPVIDVAEPGVPGVPAVASDSDIRTDIPRYRVFEQGDVIDEPTDVTDNWRDDAVAFLLGCSMTFEPALLRAGVPLRHLDAGTQAPIYVTQVRCQSAGRFGGPLVVSLRPVPAPLVSRAVKVTSRYPLGHGAPVHVGAPEDLGIDLEKMDFGDAPVVAPGDVPVFWACGVTPQLAVREARPRYMITHYPEHMYVTDRSAEADAAF